MDLQISLQMATVFGFFIVEGSWFPSLEAQGGN